MNNKFIKSNMKSPKIGMFDIFISHDMKTLFKKKRKPIKNIVIYKKLIDEAINHDIFGQFIHKPENIYIEDDGSYYCENIRNGIRLYDINLNSNINTDILDNLDNLIKCVKDLKEILNNYKKKKPLFGDWALHNLIYCFDTKRIYNIDLEGFYTYSYILEEKLDFNDWFNTLLIILDKLNKKKYK